MHNDRAVITGPSNLQRPRRERQPLSTQASIGLQDATRFWIANYVRWATKISNGVRMYISVLKPPARSCFKNKTFFENKFSGRKRKCAFCIFSLLDLWIYFAGRRSPNRLNEKSYNSHCDGRKFYEQIWPSFSDRRVKFRAVLYHKLQHIRPRNVVVLTYESASVVSVYLQITFSVLI